MNGLQIDKQGQPNLVIDGLDEEQKRVQRDVNKLQEELAELEKEAERLRFMQKIVKSLPMSWQQQDPGKYKPAYCFLTRRYSCAVVQELLLPGTEIFTESQRKEWNEYQGERPYYQPYDKVPPYYTVIPFADVLKVACPICGELQPVVEFYAQTEDGPDGDTWEKWDFVLHCGRAQEIWHKVSVGRF